MKHIGFESNFVKLLKIFDKHPHMLISFLKKHDGLTESFKKKIAKSVLRNKPSFSDINDMVDYYNGLLSEQQTTAKNKELHWNGKLYKAISEQKFEEAAKIRDHMNKYGYKITI